MSLIGRAVSVILPVTDVDRARTYYSESLGLEFTGNNDEGGAMFSLGGCSTLVLVPRPGSQPSEVTAMSFEIDDIHSEITDLMSRGVVFEDYDLPEIRTVDHVCVLGSERAAWFKDPDGNILCLHQTRS